jgi:beta-galactosidase
MRKHTDPTNLSTFLFGVPYYPEQWTEKDREHDPERMKSAGVNTVRMAEFAWDLMEPREGTFDFSHFDHHIERLAKVGIKTVLCTPTAAPPRWLTKQYPEVLRVDKDDKQMRHGSRQHASHCSARFRDFSKKITAAMANHYKENKNVVGWQTDNEFHCHFKDDYSHAAEAGFRTFLQSKYGNIAALNTAWGTAFWALTYDSIDDIELPYNDRPTHVNPTHYLDYQLFLSHAVTEFQHHQVQILRNANPNWWIFHNGFFGGIDYREFSKDLDFFAVDVYPYFCPQATRAAWAASVLDRTRSIAGNFIVPELQTGPGGQGHYLHTTPPPGHMRLMAWQCVARGADGILHFRWRSARFGAEEYWCGVLDHDNKPRARYEEFSQEGAEFARLGSVIIGTTVHPQIAVCYDTGLIEMAHNPIHHGLPSPGYAGEVIWKAFWEGNFSVGYVHPLDDLSRIKLLFVPSMAVITPEIATALTQFVTNGGHLVITARTGQRNANSQVISETFPGLLATLVGATVEGWTRVNENAAQFIHDPETGSFEWDGLGIERSLWMETLEVNTARVVAKWTVGRFARTPAVTKNSVGKGSCWYVGTYLDETSASVFAEKLTREIGLSPLLPEATEPVPDSIEVCVRESEHRKLLFVLNHAGEPVTIPQLPQGIDLLTNILTTPKHPLAPYGVMVIKLA